MEWNGLSSIGLIEWIFELNGIESNGRMECRIE